MNWKEYEIGDILYHPLDGSMQRITDIKIIDYRGSPDVRIYYTWLYNPSPEYKDNGYFDEGCLRYDSCWILTEDEAMARLI